jgi:hypothetical protein
LDAFRAQRALLLARDLVAVAVGDDIEERIAIQDMNDLRLPWQPGPVAEGRGIAARTHHVIDESRACGRISRRQVHDREFGELAADRIDTLDAMLRTEGDEAANIARFESDNDRPPACFSWNGRRFDFADERLEVDRTCVRNRLSRDAHSSRSQTWAVRRPSPKLSFVSSRTSV